MKAIILILLYVFVSLEARDIPQNVKLSFASVEMFSKEISPAVKIKSELSEGVHFIMMYANNHFNKSVLERPVDYQNPKAQNLYLSMNYRF